MAVGFGIGKGWCSHVLLSSVLDVFLGGPAVAMDYCQDYLALLVGRVLQHGLAEIFVRSDESPLKSEALFPFILD